MALRISAPRDARRSRPVLLGVSAAVTAGLLALLALFALSARLAAFQSPASAPPPLRSGTANHDLSPQWTPPQGAPAGLQYVGAAVCAQCHGFEASQLKTAMGHGSEAIPATGNLIQFPVLRRTINGDVYTITRQPDGQALYSVRADGQEARAMLAWAFGVGYAGQTYVYRDAAGRWRESRVSFYQELHGLDITMGDQNPPAGADAALGRILSPDEARSCFGCHTTGAIRAGVFTPQLASPGVTCEQCHGPGSAHVAAMRAHNFSDFHIFNPAKLVPAAQLEFCGACHRTTLDVLEMGVTGVLDVRFQPYRLTLSACYNPTDARISCLACHNPHQELDHKLTDYDAKCLACHANRPRPGAAAAAPPAGTAKPGPACPVAAQDCASCHMPQISMPGAHHRFFDHYIRVVKPGAPYPD